MLILPIFLLTSVAAFWLLAHQTVKRRFAVLRTKLPDAYHSAIAVPPGEGSTPQLVALCIDLMRKEHCTSPFNTLSPHEQKMALHAYAIQVLPTWMSRYAALALSPANKRLISQLRQVKSSRPSQPKVYFGAVKAQQQLRSRPET